MTWLDPIPFRESGDDEAPHIVEMLAAVGVDLDLDSVRLLVSIARQAHRRALSDWMHHNEPKHMGPAPLGPYAQWDRRRPGNAGRFRDESDLPRRPLAAIYFLCNEWWRRETGLPFHPDFRPVDWSQDFTLHEQLAMLKGAALFYTLIAQAVDFYNYSAKRCSLVHDGNYKRLDKRIP